MAKEKPPEIAGAVASASLLAALKTKVDEAEEAASFFSSGFPKANICAAGALSVCKDPKVELLGGLVASKFRSPSLPKTEPVVFVLVGVDVVSSEDTALLFFS